MSVECRGEGGPFSELASRGGGGRGGGGDVPDSVNAGIRTIDSYMYCYSRLLRMHALTESGYRTLSTSGRAPSCRATRVGRDQSDTSRSGRRTSSRPPCAALPDLGRAVRPAQVGQPPRHGQDRATPPWWGRSTLPRRPPPHRGSDGAHRPIHADLGGVVESGLHRLLWAAAAPAMPRQRLHNRAQDAYRAPWAENVLRVGGGARPRPILQFCKKLSLRSPSGAGKLPWLSSAMPADSDCATTFSSPSATPPNQPKLSYNDGESEIRAPRTLALLPLALTLFHLSSLTYYHQLKVYIAHSILQSHLVTIVFVVRCEGCDIPVLWLLFISSMAV